MSPPCDSGVSAMDTTDVTTFTGALALQLVSRWITLSGESTVPVGSNPVASTV